MLSCFLRSCGLLSINCFLHVLDAMGIVIISCVPLMIYIVLKNKRINVFLFQNLSLIINYSPPIGWKTGGWSLKCELKITRKNLISYIHSIATRNGVSCITKLTSFCFAHSMIQSRSFKCRLTLISFVLWMRQVAYRWKLLACVENSLVWTLKLGLAPRIKKIYTVHIVDNLL